MCYRALLIWVAAVGLGDAKAAPSIDAIEIMVEDAAPPWSEADGSGYANEVVVAAFQAMGVRADLVVVPYERCKRAVLRGKAPACVSVTMLPEYTGLIKPASSPLIRLNSDIFENVDKPLPKPPRNDCRLPPGTLTGIVRGYEYPSEVTALIASGIDTEAFNSDLHSLKSLAAGRIDAAVVNTNDLKPKSEKAIRSGVADKVKFAFNCGRYTGTIGFSTKHPRGQWAYETYEKGYQRILKNGVKRTIDARWIH